ncbi:MAG: preprotein translocase subunit SecY [Spirochaetales bacterium]|nr:preprotein translocase subunit SecY [Spirochaetales bacterium]
MASNPIIDIFRIKDLRNRILFTIFVLVIFRLGAFIPIPGIDRTAVLNYFEAGAGGFGEIFNFLDFFVGGAFKNVSIFMLGVMPYITTSIIMNLLTIIFPKLKKISEEEGGKKKIQRYTRYITIPVCMIQSFTATRLAVEIKALTIDPLFFTFVAMLTVTTGTVFLVWLGEQITQRGIGNGVSILIFAGIVARMPEAVITMFQAVRDPSSDFNPVFLIIVLAVFTVVVALVIYEQQGQRKIPVYYAKRVIGRKIYGSQNTYLPFKINPSGVIPVIFASALLTFPIQLIQGLGKNITFLQNIVRALAWDKLPYNLLYGLLIVFFAYFYTQVTLNPFEISKNIRENGGSIPGIRSEKMEEYLTRILNRIILPGSLFLAFIAIIPTIVSIFFKVPRSAAMLMGGTSLLIMVGVDLDTMSQIEGHLRMHHHEGLVKKGKLRSRNL